MSLSVQCLRSVAVNMTSMPRSELQYLPNHYQEQFRPESFIQVKFNLWPRHIRGESTILGVKKDMIISEVLLLLRQKLKLGSDLKVNVLKNCIHLEDDDILQTENEDYDCVFSSCKPLTNISCLAGNPKRDLPTATMKDVSICILQPMRNKAKATVTFSFAFSRSLPRLHVIDLYSDWLIYVCCDWSD